MNIKQALANEEAFAVVPLKTCPHIDLFNSQFTPNGKYIHL